MKSLRIALVKFLLWLADILDPLKTIDLEEEEIPEVEIAPGVHAMGVFAGAGRGKYPGFNGNSHQRRKARRARKNGAL